MFDLVGICGVFLCKVKFKRFIKLLLKSGETEVNLPTYLPSHHRQASGYDKKNRNMNISERTQ